MALYIVMLVLLFGVSVFLIYVNFFAGGGSTATAPVVKNAGSATAGDAALYQEHELDFLQDAKFQALRNFGKPVTVESGRSSNPFSLP